MTDDRTSTSGEAAAAEPALTEKNSETVREETTLADEGGTTADEGRTTAPNLSGETSTRTKSGAIPSSYGAAGGTTDAYEEGAGEAESHGSGT
jgi:hypothetical protein